MKPVRDPFFFFRPDKPECSYCGNDNSEELINEVKDYDLPPSHVCKDKSSCMQRYSETPFKKQITDTLRSRPEFQGGYGVVASWDKRYSSSKYDGARQEYLAKFVYKGLKDTDEAKKFYAEKVLPLKPKPKDQPETTSRDLTPSGPMKFDVAMSHPHYLGDSWIQGTGPKIKGTNGE